MTAPARHNVDFGTGQLVFTTGGNEQAVGFRCMTPSRTVHRIKWLPFGIQRRGNSPEWLSASFSEHTVESRPPRVGRTVFLSAGLAGTEVLVAEALLRS